MLIADIVGPTVTVTGRSDLSWYNPPGIKGLIGPRAAPYVAAQSGFSPFGETRLIRDFIFVSIGTLIKKIYLIF